jgi:hypothetical protein
MAQTFLRIIIDGFHDGEFDFAAALQRKPGAEQAAFDDFISALVAAEEDPTSDIFWAVTIIGHADRYDVSGASSEERRARELDASRQRMDSAGNFVFTRFGDTLSADGFTRPATVDDPTNVGFDVVPAGAADLVNLVPASEAEREQNRRVKFLAIQFSPQPQAVAFGEQNLDRNVA